MRGARGGGCPRGRSMALLGYGLEILGVGCMWVIRDSEVGIRMVFADAIGIVDVELVVVVVIAVGEIVADVDLAGHRSRFG